MPIADYWNNLAELYCLLANTCFYFTISVYALDWIVEVMPYVKINQTQNDSLFTQNR